MSSYFYQVTHAVMQSFCSKLTDQHLTFFRVTPCRMADIRLLLASPVGLGVLAAGTFRSLICPRCSEANTSSMVPTKIPKLKEKKYSSEEEEEATLLMSWFFPVLSPLYETLLKQFSLNVLHFTWAHKNEALLDVTVSLEQRAYISRTTTEGKMPPLPLWEKLGI